MREPMEILDKFDMESLDEKQTLSEYLEWLEWLRDELEIRINNVQRDADNKKK